MNQNVEQITQELRRQATELTRAADILENASNGAGRSDNRVIKGIPKTARKMSAAGRRSIAKAQRKRWQKFHLVQGGKKKVA